jgi:phosphatidylserine decarboxylase
VTFAKESWPFVLPPLAAAVLLAVFGYPWAAAAALALALGVLLFFRNPRRRYDGPADAVLAAADGRVLRVETVADEEVGEGTYHRVVTFLSVFDVHVQRSPVGGETVVSRRRSGRKVAAFRAQAGVVNEQHLSVFRLPDGGRVGVRQIAGLVARRVVCYLEAGQAVERGEVMGLIKFGSRVDLLVPAGYRLLVAPGDRLRTGATAVALPPARREEKA